MPNASELTKTIKRAAIQAARAEKPAEVCFGKVIKASPLKILVEQKMTLGKAQLVLARNVTDFKTRASEASARKADPPVGASGPDADSGDAEETEVAVCNGLAAGDEVVLIRQQGGQKYVVLDRVET